MGLGLYVPHRHCYTLSSDRLLMIVERAELHLSPSADLPPNVILLAAPADASELSSLSADEVWHNYWRLLFHSRVHVELERQVSEGILTEERIESRVREIGLTEFAEIQAVLQREDLLLPPRLNRETYIEFAAVFLELSYFSPQELSWYFPCLRDWERIKRLLGEDVDHARLFHATRFREPRLVRSAWWQRTRRSVMPITSSMSIHCGLRLPPIGNCWPVPSGREWWGIESKPQSCGPRRLSSRCRIVCRRRAPRRARSSSDWWRACRMCCD